MSQTEPTMRSFEAMGTRFECVLAGFGRGMTSATHATAAAEEVERIVREWHDLLSAFSPNSAISRINTAETGGPVRVPRDLLDLLARAKSYTSDTLGAFDITLGALMAQHGFRGEETGSDSYGADALLIDERASTIRLARPGVRLDLGAIAKGFALDRCAEELRDLGVTSALLHGGTSSVIAIGTRPDGHPWQIQISADYPDAPVVELTDSAMSVSEPRGRIIDGRGHILDPRRGESADRVELACVRGPSAEVCEIWSTALVVDPNLIEQLPVGYRAHARIDQQWISTDKQAACA
ncbi:MAG: FAD:protein FMN transferase [Phycisphaerales bacterium JB065]